MAIGDCLGTENPIRGRLYGCGALETVGFEETPKMAGGLSSKVGGLARLTVPYPWGVPGVGGSIPASVRKLGRLENLLCVQAAEVRVF